MLFRSLQVGGGTAGVPHGCGGKRGELDDVRHLRRVAGNGERQLRQVERFSWVAVHPLPAFLQKETRQRRAPEACASLADFPHPLLVRQYQKLSQLTGGL